LDSNWEDRRFWTEYIKNIFKSTTFRRFDYVFAFRRIMDIRGRSSLYLRRVFKLKAGQWIMSKIVIVIMIFLGFTQPLREMSTGNIRK
jgi:hypothetical protein